MKRIPEKRYPEYTVDPEPNVPTERQQAFLDRHNLQSERPMNFHEASDTIGQYIRSCRQTSPSLKQQQLLKAHGKWREGMNRGEAFDAIKALLATNPPAPTFNPLYPPPPWLIPPAPATSTPSPTP